MLYRRIMRRRFIESFEKHDTLNPKIWGSNNELLPEVKKKLFDIVSYFVESLSVPVTPIDAHLVGSNASYNYTDKSDLDLHIIVNFDTIDAPKEITQLLFNSDKGAFNASHDITIHGVEVELYIEDVKATTVSNGIYSLFDDEWIKFPVKLDSVPDVNVDALTNKWELIIQEALTNGDSNDIQEVIDTLYLIRKNSIDVDGEYGKGNILFKSIRNKGLLQELKDALNSKKSKELSLESLSVKEATRYLNR